MLNINLSANVIDSDKGFNEEKGDVFIILKLLILGKYLLTLSSERLKLEDWRLTLVCINYVISLLINSWNFYY